jgi:hypothetical protein
MNKTTARGSTDRAGPDSIDRGAPTSRNAAVNAARTPPKEAEPQQCEPLRFNRPACGADSVDAVGRRLFGSAPGRRLSAPS